MLVPVFVFAGILCGLLLCLIGRHLRAVQLENHKLIRGSKGGIELYDLAADPLETRELSDEKPDKVKELERELDKWLQSFKHYKVSPQAIENIRVPTPVEMEAMKGFGYIR